MQLTLRRPHRRQCVVTLTPTKDTIVISAGYDTLAIQITRVWPLGWNSTAGVFYKCRKLLLYSADG